MEYATFVATLPTHVAREEHAEPVGRGRDTVCAAVPAAIEARAAPGARLVLAARTRRARGHAVGARPPCQTLAHDGHVRHGVDRGAVLALGTDLAALRRGREAVAAPPAPLAHAQIAAGPEFPRHACGARSGARPFVPGTAHALENVDNSRP